MCVSAWASDHHCRLPVSPHDDPGTDGPEPGEVQPAWKKFLSNTYVSTIITLIPSYLLCLGGYLNIWPLFGAANQLLSALVLIGLAVFLRTTGRKSWMLYFPMTFMFVVTMSALCLSIYGVYTKIMAGTFAVMVGRFPAGSSPGPDVPGLLWW